MFVFTPSPLRAPSPPSNPFHRSTLLSVWHHSPFRFSFWFPHPSCFVSRFFFRVHPSKSFISKTLSPSFVALVKMFVGTTFYSPFALSRALLFCLAAVPACVLCVCFAYVSMSNDSIPHWPMHNNGFFLFSGGLCIRVRVRLSVRAEIRSRPTHDDRVPTKERYHAYPNYAYNLSHPDSDWDPPPISESPDRHTLFAQLS